MHLRLQANPALRHCFAVLPAAYADRLRADAATAGAIVLELRWECPELGSERRAYLTWNGARVSGKQPVLELGEAFAHALGLGPALAETGNRQLPVRIERVEMVEFPRRLELEPCTPDDWELVELHAGYLEEELLRQICVVFAGQTLPIWIHGNKLIRLRVINLLSRAPQRLSTHTEVAVAPRPRPKATPALADANTAADAPIAYPVSPPLRVDNGSSCGGQGRRRRRPVAQTAILVHPSTLAGALGLAPAVLARWKAQEEASAAAIAGHSSSNGNGRPAAGDVKSPTAPDGNIARLLGAGRLAALWLEPPPGAEQSDHHHHHHHQRGGPHQHHRHHAQGPHAVGVGVLATCPSVPPGHVLLGQGLRRQVGARPLHDAVRLRVLGPAQWPIRAATLTLHPVQWIVPAEAHAQRGRGGEGEEEAKARAFLEGGLGAMAAVGGEHQHQLEHGGTEQEATAAQRRQQREQQAVVAALQEWIAAEAARSTAAATEDKDAGTPDVAVDAGSINDADVFLADGALLSLRVGPDKTPRTYALAIHSSLPGPAPTPLYVALASAPTTLQLAPRPAPRAWLVDDPLGLLDADHLLGGRDAELAACRAHLAPALHPPAAAARVCAGVGAPGMLLVHGQPASGKTALCRALAAEAAAAWGAAPVWVDCAALRGQKMAAVLGALAEAVQRARASAPALLVLDGLDALAPAESEDAGDANLQGAEIADHVMALLRGQAAWAREAEAALARAGAGGGMARLVRAHTNRGSSSRAPPEQQEQWALLEAAAVAGAVAVIATGRDPGGVHATLRRPGGIEGLVEVPPLDAKGRVAVLRALLRRHLGVDVAAADGGEGASSIDLAALSARLEGCTPADLELLVARALHASAARRLDAAAAAVATTRSRRRRASAAALAAPLPLLAPADVEEAMDGFTPAALRNAKLAASATTWQDIGGLAAVKAEVRDLLEVPTRFAPLYARLPTRLPTGLLLYGPPGCGKTHLAGAVARECGLSFISVKGPEVLDKYIGASEQAVRALFARAGAAAPCVLFFDEFEALAPRRGNDNTGVTDRVVNQLLTFLDGVEGRSGVYVMGATSRPDMIDPALLRPGRLDRQLYLGFPDAEERAAILAALSRRMQLAPGARAALPAVAGAEGAGLLTGADLQALLGTAQLNAVHEALSALGVGGGGGGSAAAVEVTERHLWEALDATRPSLAPKERAHFQAIYDKFRSSRKGDFKVAASTDDGTHLRTALK